MSEYAKYNPEEENISGASKEEGKKASGIISKIGKHPLARVLAFAAGVGAAGTEFSACNNKHENPQPVLVEKERSSVKDWSQIINNTPPHFIFDNPANQELLKPVYGGKYSEEEKEKHWKVLKNGVRIFEDGFAKFYQVEEGDTIASIKEKLQEDFPQLLDQKNRLNAFNIKEEDLTTGIMLPIPQESSKRRITDEQFVRYAYLALEDMKNHPIYSFYINYLIQNNQTESLIADMLAVVKQESGGKAIGQFETQRYEKHHDVFSVSFFHVLMKDAGLTARIKLNMTEGQTYHPLNACKLFWAFTIEKILSTGANSQKTINKLNGLFPIDNHLADFSAFYNGKKYDSKYPETLHNYRVASGELLKKILTNDTMEGTGKGVNTPKNPQISQKL